MSRADLRPCGIVRLVRWVGGVADGQQRHRRHGNMVRFEELLNGLLHPLRLATLKPDIRFVQR